jgi:hypothetical protein
MGFPMPDKKTHKMEFFRLDLFPTEDDGEGIILLEELSSAPLSIQTPLYQFCWDRELWSYKLPKGWLIASTGNRVEDKASAERMSTALSSRFTHWTLDIDLDTFRSFCFGNNIHPIIPAYLGKATDGLNDFNPKLRQKSFACPRTWEILSNQLMVLCPTMDAIGNALNDPMTRTQLLESCIGTVGEGHGNGIFGFMQLFSRLFNPQIILDSPESAPIPSNIDEMFAITGALVNMSTLDNIDHIIKYYKRMPGHMKDFLDKYFMDVRRKFCGNDKAKKDLFAERVKYWKTWVMNNQEIILPS